MPNPTPDPGVDEWVLASAAEVARNVARHGVPITWSEAAERLRRTVELLSGPVFVVDDGGTFTPLPQQEIPRWQETGFAESVACAAVHYAGQPYYPENPQSSRVELAVPWDAATALVHLLNADVAFEFSRDDDELLGDEEKVVGERVYLLMQSCDVWQALDLLGNGREALRLAGVTDMEILDLTLWEASCWLFGPYEQAS